MAAIVGFWTDYVLNKENDLWLRATSVTVPSNLYAGLCTTTANRAVTPVELASTGSYARVSVGFSNFSASSSGQTSNTATITFPTPTADWAKVYSVVLYDASTAGNALAVCGIADSGTYQTRLTGQTLVLPIGALLISRT